MDLTKVTMSTINTALISDLSGEKPKSNSEHRSRQVTRILGELAASKKITLVIDEAQRVPVDTLEKLKMLTERRWAFRSKLITVLLFGQVELNQKLARDEGLSLRVTQYRMAGLTPDEVLQYIDLRCRTAGGRMEEIFEAEALRYIAENQHSPLHINHVCSTVMRMARQAGEKQAKLCMVFECGGIRTPRQMMRDNNITIKRLAKELGIREYDVQRVVDGNVEEIPVEKRELIRAGLGRIIRGTEEPEAERKAG
jgi:type II secretory pathway predicted ATPase ExeA